MFAYEIDAVMPYALLMAYLYIMAAFVTQSSYKYGLFLVWGGLGFEVLAIFYIVFWNFSWWYLLETVVILILLFLFSLLPLWYTEKKNPYQGDGVFGLISPLMGIVIALALAFLIKVVYYIMKHIFMFVWKHLLWMLS